MAIERAYLPEVLERAGGVVTRAAELAEWAQAARGDASRIFSSATWQASACQIDGILMARGGLLISPRGRLDATVVAS